MFDAIDRNSIILGNKNLGLPCYIATLVTVNIATFHVVYFINKKVLPFAISSIDSAIDKVMNILHIERGNQEGWGCIENLKYRVERYYGNNFEDHIVLDRTLRITARALRHIIVHKTLKFILDRVLVRSICYLKGK